MKKEIKHFECKCGKKTSAVNVIPFCKKCRNTMSEVIRK